MEKAKKKGKRNIAKIIALCIIVAFLLFYVGSLIYISFSGNEIASEIALLDTAVKTVPVEMFVVRDEKLIPASGANIVSAVSDGTRVNVNETVAYAFSDSVSAGNIVRMKQISEQLNYYSDLLNKSSSVVSDTTAYDNRIMQDVISLASSVSSGKLEDLAEKKNKLRDSITSKQTATGVKLDLSASVSALQTEYDSLKNTTSSYTEIKSGSTGYYISGTDGYENVLNYADVDKWTISDIENALKAEPAPSGNVVGRIVHGYYWYLACVTDTANINSLNEGDRKTISLPDSSIDDFTAQIYSIRSDRSTGKSLIIFRCILMNEDFASLRHETARIHIQSFKGYRVDNNAIRVNKDNEPGVYVIRGAVMNFKKVEIVYSSDDYSIVINPYEDNPQYKYDYINMYDRYITDGKNLEDGKLIK